MWMKFEFTSDYNNEIHEHIDGLFNLENETIEQRSHQANQLIEAYIKYVSQDAPSSPDVRMADYSQQYIPKPKSTMPPSTALERIGSYIMREDYEDKRRNKVAITEYPTLSEDQIKRRNRKEFVNPDLQEDKSGSVGTTKRVMEDGSGKGILIKRQIMPSTFHLSRTQKPLY